MIAHLKGHILGRTDESVIIDANGVGYEVFVPVSTLAALPDADDFVSLHIHTYVREDALSLFGFSSLLEKQVFRMLISVSGIGPRLSLAMLSDIGAASLVQAISDRNGSRLQTVSGVGKKTAERIVLELGDKAAKMLENADLNPCSAVEESVSVIAGDAVSALLNLGYPVKRAEDAVMKAQKRAGGQDLETLIKIALRFLSG